MARPPVRRFRKNGVASSTHLSLKGTVEYRVLDVRACIDTHFSYLDTLIITFEVISFGISL